MLHYLITNRQVIKNASGSEYIQENGLDDAGEPGEIIRFALFDSDKFRRTQSCRASVTLLPELSVIEKQIERRLENDGDLLCYIHGFHTNFKGTLKDICALEEKYIHQDSPVKYIVGLTWPARENLFFYDDDAKDAELSGFTFAQSYNLLTDFFKLISGTETGVRHIHLLAHSMGNRMLEHMLHYLSTKKDFEFTPVFKEVILAAADTDWQGFEDPYAFAKLKLLTERITVYYHEGDKALFLSEATQNKNKRLGRYGFRNCEKIEGNIYSVDCSGIIDQHGFSYRLIEHSYYQVSDATVKDIICVLKGKPVDAFLKESLRIEKTKSQREFRLNVS